MFNLLILLIAVINLTNTQDTPEPDSLDILSGLASSTLGCSLQFDKDFIANNADIAAAFEELRDKEREAKPTREPCEDGEDCTERRPHEKERRGDSEEEVDATEAPEDTVELRRILRGRGKGKGKGRRGDATKEPLADGETREPRQTREPKDGTKEPCEDGKRSRGEKRGRKDDSSDDDETTEAPTEVEASLELRRNLGRGKGKGRGRRRDATKEPLADGETREPRQTREPKDGTKEPCADGEDCRDKRRHRRDDDSTKEPCDDSEDDATEPPTEVVLELRRNLRRGKGKGRGRRGEATKEPLADGETREPRQTREPKDGTKEPCADGEDCRPKRRRHDSDRPCDKDETTEEPVEDTVQLRRLLRRSGDDADATVDQLEDKAPCEDEECENKRRRSDKRRGGRRDDDSTKKDKRRFRGRSLDAVISDKTIEIAGVAGTVEFGEVDAELESISLTLTLGETVFQCEMEVRRNGQVSCRARSEDNHKVRIGCAVEADEETDEA